MTPAKGGFLELRASPLRGVEIISHHYRMTAVLPLSSRSERGWARQLLRSCGVVGTPAMLHDQTSP